MDACSDSALRVSCGLERLSGGRRRERLARLPPPLHFSSAGRIAACGSRPARSRLATRLTHVWRASATHTDSMTYRRSAARLPRDTGPRGQAAHSVGSGQLRRFAPASGPRFSLRSSGRGVGCPQCLLRPSVSARPRPQSMTRSPSIPPRVSNGPGAQSVGQRLPVTAAPTPTRTPSRALRVRLAVSGQAARVGCWTGRGGRHADLDTRVWGGVSVRSPTRCRLGRLSRTAEVSDPRL